MKNAGLNLIISNDFLPTNYNDIDTDTSGYQRAVQKIIDGGRSGKIQPVYLMIGKTYKFFGLITLNVGGSISLFPELPGTYGFDHITFNKDLMKDGHHFTQTENGKHKKILPLSAELLDNGLRHAVTFLVSDLNTLKNASKNILLTGFNENHFDEIYESFFTKGKHEGSTILKLDEATGTLVVQMYLIPKDADFTRMNPFLQNVHKLYPELNLDPGTELKMFNAVIPHESHDDFYLGIQSFIIPKKMNCQLAFVMSAKKLVFTQK